MAESNLPLLVFPHHKVVEPTRAGFPPSSIHFPTKERQVERLQSKIDAVLADSLSGLEPERVLVIEIFDSVDNFRQAAEVAGLEWLGEFDSEEIEADKDFYKPPTIGKDFFKGKIQDIQTKNQWQRIRQELVDCGFIN